MPAIGDAVLSTSPDEANEVFTVLDINSNGTVVIQDLVDGTTQTVSANQLVVVSA
jgi:Ca2+-binding EF-hand superfamily protein